VEDLSQRQRRAADNQALFRTVNERIEQLNETFEMFAPYGEWTCECAHLECFATVEMTLAEYENVRSRPDRFAVAPSDEHVLPEVEDIVERTERYWIVEKIGVGGERAIELDGRGADGSLR
jgi:hypothetical protein